MESSNDDGDPSVAIIAKSLLLLLVLIPAIHKPTKTVPQVFKEPVTKVVSSKEKSPPVAQKEKKKKPSKKKKLYITFDDGPNKGTRNVLDIVKDEQVPITFFIVGEHVFASKGQKQTWDSLKIAQQIELCNHSYTHAHGRYEKFYQQPDSVVSDFRRAQDSLQLVNSIVRTPGRNIWRIDSLCFTDLKKSAAAADSLQKAGFIVMGWDLEWHFDPKTMSVKTTAEKMVDEIDSVFRHNRTKNPDHLVLLAHDQAYFKSADSFQLRQFFQLLKKKDVYELNLATVYPGTEE